MLKRLSLATVFGILALLLVATPASAGLVWCQGDPVVSLNGTTVQIMVAIPVDDQPLVTGPIQAVIGTPASVRRNVLLTDGGFNGYGEQVTFRDTNVSYAGSVFPVDISVTVPVGTSHSGGRDIPVTMTISTAGSDPLVVQGTAAWTHTHVNVPSTS